MGEGGARTATMAHLANLMALAAAGCSPAQPEPATVTLTAPPAPSGTAAATATATARTVSTATAVPVSTVVPYVVTQPMHGYDPVGPPPRLYCLDVARGTRTRGAVRHAAGILEVELQITLAASGPSSATFPVPHTPSTSAVQAYGGIVTSSKFAAHNASVRLRPNGIVGKTGSIMIYVPLLCQSGSGSLMVRATFDPAASTVNVDHTESR